MRALFHTGGIALSVSLAVTTGAWAQQPGSTAAPPAGGIDEDRAATYFREAQALCEREGGRLWGVSLCGPIVFADAQTGAIATNQPAPDAPRPAVLGYANTALDWSGTRWTTVVWRMIPATDSVSRARLIVHELFHRVQPRLGFFLNERSNDHLETLDGRYWMQLEWRALAAALEASGDERLVALRDALAFRAARFATFEDARESERVLAINEGLAQYTGTVVSTSTHAEAVASALAQLRSAPREQTFVRTFAYPMGAAYGVLLDVYAPGWTRRLEPTDDLADLVALAARVRPTPDARVAARRHGGSELRITEEKLEAERRARLADYRHRFVEGPVLVIPRPRSASFVTNGLTPIPGAGTVYPTYRATSDWGSIEGQLVLVWSERGALTVPAPFGTEGAKLTGDGWTLTLAPGWVVRPGGRTGDFEIVREAPPPDDDTRPGMERTGGRQWRFVTSPMRRE